MLDICNDNIGHREFEPGGMSYFSPLLLTSLQAFSVYLQKHCFHFSSVLFLSCPVFLLFPVLLLIWVFSSHSLVAIIPFGLYLHFQFFSHQRSNVVFACMCKTYSTWEDGLKVHPLSYQRLKHILLYGRVVLHHICIKKSCLVYGHLGYFQALVINKLCCESRRHGSTCL